MIKCEELNNLIHFFKEWKKFGAASNDPEGPNPANTIIAEEVQMQFVHGKDVSLCIEKIF